MGSRQRAASELQELRDQGERFWGGIIAEENEEAGHLAHLRQQVEIASAEEQRQAQALQQELAACENAENFIAAWVPGMADDVRVMALAADSGGPSAAVLAAELQAAREELSSVQQACAKLEAQRAAVQHEDLDIWVARIRESSQENQMMQAGHQMSKAHMRALVSMTTHTANQISAKEETHLMLLQQVKEHEAVAVEFREHAWAAEARMQVTREHDVAKKEMEAAMTIWQQEKPFELSLEALRSRVASMRTACSDAEQALVAISLRPQLLREEAEKEETELSRTRSLLLTWTRELNEGHHSSEGAPVEQRGEEAGLISSLREVHARTEILRGEVQAQEAHLRKMDRDLRAQAALLEEQSHGGNRTSNPAGAPLLAARPLQLANASLFNAQGQPEQGRTHCKALTRASDPGPAFLGSSRVEESARRVSLQQPDSMQVQLQQKSVPFGTGNTPLHAPVLSGGATAPFRGPQQSAAQGTMPNHAVEGEVLVNFGFGVSRPPGQLTDPGTPDTRPLRRTNTAQASIGSTSVNVGSHHSSGGAGEVAQALPFNVRSVAMAANSAPLPPSARQVARETVPAGGEGRSLRTSAPELVNWSALPKKAHPPHMTDIRTSADPQLRPALASCSLAAPCYQNHTQSIFCPQPRGLQHAAFEHPVSPSPLLNEAPAARVAHPAQEGRGGAGGDRLSIAQQHLKELRGEIGAWLLRLDHDEARGLHDIGRGDCGLGGTLGLVGDDKCGRHLARTCSNTNVRPLRPS